MPKENKNVVCESIIISLGYCVLYTMIFISFATWEESPLKRIFFCFLLFMWTIIIGTLCGGLVGTFLEERIPYNIKYWKYLVILFISNLFSPLFMYLLMNYHSEYE